MSTSGNSGDKLKLFVTVQLRPPGMECGILLEIFKNKLNPSVFQNSLIQSWTLGLQ